MKIYIGIDPGADGGFTVMYENGVVCKPWDNEAFTEEMRNVVVRMIAEKCQSVCCLEKVGAMPGQGVTSMFNFGKSAGFIEGVLQANKIPYQLTPPIKWKKEYSLNSDKKKSIQVAKQLFPSVSLKRTERCTTDHDGMAESLLMAEYARRTM